MPKPQLQDLGTRFSLIVTEGGQVAVRFDEKIKELIFTAEQAKTLGLGFIEMGTRAEYVQALGPGVYPSTVFPHTPARKM
jgi:hypothetical protein